ncbi:MAG TPA: hypothetical protein VLK34_00825 [Nocardioidaceae bacterium]|nr:hypothetical protein [Nocardioidaceae bacterium]
MAELKTVMAIAAAAATFAVGAVVASSMSSSHSSALSDQQTADHPTTMPEVGDYANEWHVQTAVASYESRVLRYAQADDAFAGARFAFRSGAFILYSSSKPSPVVRRLLVDPPLDIQVTWVRVPFSRSELDRAVHLLRQAMPARSVVDYAPNFGGVLVGLHPLPATPTQQARLYSRAQHATDVPVTFLQAGLIDPM